MRRQRRAHHDDDYRPTSTSGSYNPMLKDADEFLQMDPLTRGSDARKQPHRFENTIEAKVEDGDTLQALSLRFHCTVAEIKRLNKIDKDNEIYARKVLKIPVTVHSVLLGTLPQVHKSGNNSPRDSPKSDSLEENGDAVMSHIMRNPLENAPIMLNEKLMIASVNAAGAEAASNKSVGGGSINNIILNSQMAANTTIYTDDVPLSHSRLPSIVGDANDCTAALLDDDYMPRPIRGPSLRTIDCSGSDCDMSWVCLFVVILALCFIIPLVYVFYLMEQGVHHHNSTAH